MRGFVGCVLLWDFFWKTVSNAEPDQKELVVMSSYKGRVARWSLTVEGAEDNRFPGVVCTAE